VYLNTTKGCMSWTTRNMSLRGFKFALLVFVRDRVSLFQKREKYLEVILEKNVHSKELRDRQHDEVREVSGTIYQELQGRNVWNFCLNN
jgi:hypothetical protein